MNIIEFLRFLYSHSRVLSLRELSYITALSDRTIRTIIAEANDQSETLGCHVDLIRSVGYQLIIEDQTLFSSNVLLKKEYALKSIEFDILSELFQSPFIKIDELCSRYYVSKGTINKTIKHLKEKLCKYGLQILSKPYLGLYITGSEYLTRQIAAIYRAWQRGEATPESPFTPFAEVVDEYQRYAGSEAWQRDKAFWQAQRQALPAPASLSAAPLGQRKEGI